MGQWLDAWRYALAGLAARRRGDSEYCVVRLEDLLADETATRDALAALVAPRRRSRRRLLTIHDPNAGFGVNRSYLIHGDKPRKFARGPRGDRPPGPRIVAKISMLVQEHAHNECDV